MTDKIIVNGNRVYVKKYEVSKTAPNIIFIITPIGSVDAEYVQGFFDGMVNKSCNVFAVDFPGIGKSEGGARDISIKNMEETVLKLIGYIRSEYNDNIHFYGGTGAGGIIGQAMVSKEEIGRHIKSFIQYGVAVYGDTSTMGDTKTFRKMYGLLKFLNVFCPGKRIKFNVQEYSGLNAEKEDQWYADIRKKDPNAFDFKISLYKALLELFFEKDSSILSGVKCPVLVLAPKYDRYYYKEYFERYFVSLKGTKELYWIEGSHMSFDWLAKELNTKVLDWVQSK